MSKTIDFNGIAPFYDYLSKMVFGEILLKSSTHFINQLPNTGNVLYIGGGSGVLLNKILEFKPNITIDFVEKSDKFITIAKGNLKPKYANQVNFIHGNEDSLPTNKNYHAVITFFIIDLFPQTAAELFCSKINVQLLPNGIWLFTDFVASENIFNRLLLKLMYLFFRIIAHVKAQKLPNYDMLFEKLQLSEHSNKLFYRQMIRASVFIKSHSLDKNS